MAIKRKLKQLLGLNNDPGPEGKRHKTDIEASPIDPSMQAEMDLDAKYLAEREAGLDLSQQESFDNVEISAEWQEILDSSDQAPRSAVEQMVQQSDLAHLELKQALPNTPDFDNNEYVQIRNDLIDDRNAVNDSLRDLIDNTQLAIDRNHGRATPAIRESINEINILREQVDTMDNEIDDIQEKIDGPDGPGRAPKLSGLNELSKIANENAPTGTFTERVQNHLHAFGNDAGSQLKVFDLAHDWVHDRDNVTPEQVSFLNDLAQNDSPAIRECFDHFKDLTREIESETKLGSKSDIKAGEAQCEGIKHKLKTLDDLNLTVDRNMSNN